MFGTVFRICEKTASGFPEIISVLQTNQEGEDSPGEPAEKREQENQQHRAAAFVKDRQRRKDETQQITDDHDQKIIARHFDIAVSHFQSPI